MDKRKALEIALAYIQQGKLDRAIGEYQAILKADPSDFNVLNAMGDLCARTGNTAEAIAHYMRLGEVYRVDGLYVRAIAVYKKVLKLDPSYTEASLACADMYAEQGLIAEAKLQLQGIAEQYVKRGEPPKALAIYERLIRIHPGHRPTVSRIAEILIRTPRVQEALADLNGLRERLVGAGQSEDARQIYERSVELLRSQGRAGEAARFAEELNSLLFTQAEARADEVAVSSIPGNGDSEPAALALEEVKQEESALLDERGGGLEAEFEDTVSPHHGNLLVEGIPGETEERLALEETLEPGVAGSEVVQSGEEIEAAGVALDAFEGSGWLDAGGEQPSEPVAFVGSQTVEEELQEGEFYLQQGLTEEARAVFHRILLRDSEHPLAKRRLAEIEQIGGAGEDELAFVDDQQADLASPIPPLPDQESTSVFKMTQDLAPEGEYVDLAGEISEELEREEALSSDQEPEVQGMLEELERGIEEQLDTTDYETRYNLGIAYKDMELYDKALEEFRLAANDATYRVRCASLLGLCYLAKGQPEQAVEELHKGLSATEPGGEGRWAVLYDLATAYEALGDTEKALEALLAIQSEAPRFRDVRVRARDLRERLEARRGSGG